MGGSVVTPLRYGEDGMRFSILGLATSSVVLRGTSGFPVNGDTAEELLDEVDHGLRSDSRCPTAPFAT